MQNLSVSQMVRWACSDYEVYTFSIFESILKISLYLVIATCFQKGYCNLDLFRVIYEIPQFLAYLRSS